MLNKNFKPMKELIGHVEIRSVLLSQKEYCFWDNLSFFISTDKSEFKKECKKELIKKDLHEKGIFKTIKKLLKELTKSGYIKTQENE